MSKSIRMYQHLALLCSIKMPHNGIIPISEEGKEHLSDTQIFIKNVLANDDIYNTIYTDVYTQDLIQQHINGDRLAFLSPIYGILLIGDFVEDTGIYYSNGGYLPTTSLYDDVEYGRFFHGYNRW